MAENLTASFVVSGPAIPESPIILSVPHAGREYPDALLKMSRVPIENLESLEDRHADALVADAAKQGFTTIIAQRARAWIDLNRHEREVDPDMIEPRLRDNGLIRSSKVIGGLGLIPRRLRDNGELWTGRITADALRRRIEADHTPYHHALRNVLRAARARFGIAILLDVHSMPPLGDAQIVIGDRFGQSAAGAFSAIVRETSREGGFSTADNAPYAGGHILTAHGLPRRDIHAIQIEIGRDLYLRDNLRDKRSDLGGIDTLITHITQNLDVAARQLRAPLAAE